MINNELFLIDITDKERKRMIRVYDNKQFLEAVKRSEKGSIIVFDELIHHRGEKDELETRNK